ncbi:hypothetical protein WJX72_005412 [[Myrmecia] bisecta]|uniref:Uncharacterized protein n=1 Tax=[Myrmecia] bisecta TaxID=41462 RepID=A0AAW1P4X9_9CHLO
MKMKALHRCCPQATLIQPKLPPSHRLRPLRRYKLSHRFTKLTQQYTQRTRKRLFVSNSIQTGFLAAIYKRLAIRDDEKEQSRKYRRTVFTFEGWKEHRSINRYIKHMVGLLESRIVRCLMLPICYVAVLSLVLCTYETLRLKLACLAAFPSLAVQSNAPFSLTSFALSLLLVFRTNASYARCLDARKLLGSILSGSRDLMRQALTWFKKEDGHLSALLKRWTIAFSLTIKAHLWEEASLEEDLQGILLPAEIDHLVRSEHPPTYVLRVLAEAINRAGMPRNKVCKMDANLSAFTDAVTSCERILREPIPLTWTRHTSRFLVTWLTFLPATLWTQCGWATPAISVVIAFLLLGIDEIGVSLEEPFSVLPIDRLCELAQANIEEMANDAEHIRGMVRAAAAVDNGERSQRSMPQNSLSYPSRGLPPGTGAGIV